MFSWLTVNSPVSFHNLFASRSDEDRLESKTMPQSQLHMSVRNHCRKLRHWSLNLPSSISEIVINSSAMVEEMDGKIHQTSASDHYRTDIKGNYHINICVSLCHFLSFQEQFIIIERALLTHVLCNELWKRLLFDGGEVVQLTLIVSNTSSLSHYSDASIHFAEFQELL